MELDLVKKTPRLRLASDNENPSIVSGPKAFHPQGMPSDRVAAQHLLLPLATAVARNLGRCSDRADR